MNKPLSLTGFALNKPLLATLESLGYCCQIEIVSLWLSLEILQAGGHKFFINKIEEFFDRYQIASYPPQLKLC